MKCVPICAIPIIYGASIVTVSVINEFKFFEVEYIIPRYFVPLTYLRILLPACQCESFGDSMNLEISLTPYMMSCLVTIEYTRLPNTVDPSSSLLNFKPVIIGVGAILQLDILNIFKTSHAYLDYDINIPLSDCWTSMSRKKFHKTQISHLKFTFHDCFTILYAKVTNKY